MSVLLRLAYDGSGFHGWARQRGGSMPLRTVQQVVEDAITVLYKQPVDVRAASRTDAGVHALGQLVAFDPPFSIPLHGLLLGLNGRLPSDVAALAAWEQFSEDGGPIDPRHGNYGKHYRYRIRCSATRHPIASRLEWHLARPLDIDGMRAGARSLLGTHDFSAFRASDCQASTTVRTITAIDVQVVLRDPVGPAADPARLDELERSSPVAPDLVIIDVLGHAFLKNMVRIVVGTLVDVGLGRRLPASVEAVLAGRQRARAGPTAPAQGLTLVEVSWPEVTRVPP